MELPEKMRDALVEVLDLYLDAFSSDPDPEQVAHYLVEQIELAADERNIDDLVADMEEEGALDGSLVTTLEEEMTSNDEFEFTGEEIVSLLERLCEIEWSDIAVEEEEVPDDETEDVF